MKAKKDPSKLKEYRRRFYLRHRERILRECAAYRAANKAKLAAYFRQHRAKNREAYVLYDALRYHADPSRRAWNKANNKRHMATRVRCLPDSYVQRELGRREAKSFDYPPALVEAYRANLKLKRQLRRKA